MRAFAVLVLPLAACAKPDATAITLNEPHASASPSAVPGALRQPEVDSPPPAWRWDGPEPEHRRAHATAREGAVECTFTYDDRTFSARTSCSSNGRELWHRDEARAFDDGADLVIDHGTLYAARYPVISSGCSLHAIDARTGAPRWSAHLQALGPIAHSEYLNAVEVRMDRRRVVVFGWEIAGRYIEGLDSETGKPKFHVLVR